MQPLMCSMACLRDMSEEGTLWVAKEVFHTVAGVGGAETASGADQYRAHLSGELGLDLVPIVPDILPCLVAVFFDLKGDGELDGSVLVADFVGDGVVEGALNQSGVLKLGEQAERALLELGIF